MRKLLFGENIQRRGEEDRHSPDLTALIYTNVDSKNSRGLAFLIYDFRTTNLSGRLAWSEKEVCGIRYFLKKDL